MIWYDDLFLSDSLKKMKNRIKWKINHRRATGMVHLICLPSNKNNLLDIIPSGNLLQKGYPKQDLTIIGLAADYNEAIILTRDIIHEIYVNTGKMNVEEYLKTTKGET